MRRIVLFPNDAAEAIALLGRDQNRVLAMVLVGVAGAREIAPEDHERLGERHLRLGVVPWEVAEALDERRAEHVRQILAVNGAHPLHESKWIRSGSAACVATRSAHLRIIAVFRLVVEHVEEAFWSSLLLIRLSGRRGEHVARADERRDELSVRQRGNGRVTSVDRVLRRPLPVCEAEKDSFMSK